MEVLIAIFIFGLAFTGISSVLNYDLHTTAIIKNNFIASSLTQEGIEIVRNIRDRDWFLNNPDGTQPFGTSIPDGSYRVQWNSQSLIALGAGPNLKEDAASGIFSYDSGNDTSFNRTIIISTISPGIEKEVSVTVSWSDGIASRSVSAEEHLFNWK